MTTAEKRLYWVITWKLLFSGGGREIDLWWGGVGGEIRIWCGGESTGGRSFLCGGRESKLLVHTEHIFTKCKSFCQFVNNLYCVFC